MRYLIDSDWLIDAVAGKSGAVQTIERLSANGLAVSLVSVAEVYEGAFFAPNPGEMLSAYRGFLDGYAILPLTDPIVERFARMRVTLRRQGQLIPDMDLLIAATALAEDLTLVTRNTRHFQRIAGLTLYQSG